MRVLVPYAAEDPKTRLAPALDPGERAAFAGAMLRDVVAAVRAAGHEPTVLATAPVEVDAPVTVDDRPLTPAVNDALEDLPRAVVMADLPLATPAAVGGLCAAAGDVVIAPGRGGGTNALVVRHPGFRVDYHGASYLDHLRAARAAGASVREFDAGRLAADVDEPADLADLLVRGDGAASDWLRDAGFELRAADGRVRARRG